MPVISGVSWFAAEYSSCCRSNSPCSDAAIAVLTSSALCKSLCSASVNSRLLYPTLRKVCWNRVIESSVPSFKLLIIGSNKLIRSASVRLISPRRTRSSVKAISSSRISFAIVARSLACCTCCCASSRYN